MRVLSALFCAEDIKKGVREGENEMALDGVLACLSETKGDLVCGL